MPTQKKFFDPRKQFRPEKAILTQKFESDTKIQCRPEKVNFNPKKQFRPKKSNLHPKIQFSRKNSTQKFSFDPKSKILCP